MIPIRFNPYIGKKYEIQNFKILILGESHYFNHQDYLDYENEKERVKLFTNYVVNRYLQYKKDGKSFERWMNTFTKFGNVLNGKRMSNIETIDFWEKCCFYNYVQFPTRGTRLSPTNEEFRNSKDAFETVIGELKPHIVILWGLRLWSKFPKDRYEQINYKGGKIETLNLEYSLPILVLPHPSSTKFSHNLFEKINNFLELTKTYEESKQQ